MNPNLSQKIATLNNDKPDPFLRYIGGKKNIAKVLLPYIPAHSIYVEPFLGSGAFFFKKDKVASNILNDFNGDLIILYEVIRDDIEWIINWVWNTPFSESIHKRIYNVYRNPQQWNQLPKKNRAAGYYYMLQLAYNESVGNLASPAEKFSSGKHKWQQEKLIEELYLCGQKLHGVYITNRNYVELIKHKQINKEDVFWFIDPPYTMAGDKGYYQHNFTPKDHHSFKVMVDQIKGYFMITYDPHPLIQNLFSAYAQGPIPGYKNEWLITNYELNWNKYV